MITYRPHDRCLPLEHVIARRTRAARRGRVAAEIDQFLHGATVRRTANGSKQKRDVRSASILGDLP